MSYRVKEINPAYDFIPSDEWTTDELGDELKQTRKGPGWIYVSNEIESYLVAWRIATMHTLRTGLKTEIDLMPEICLPPISQ